MGAHHTLSSTEGRTANAKRPINGAVARNSAMGLCANPASSYHKAPATRAILAVCSPKCRRANTYMDAGIVRETAHSVSLTPSTYQNGWPNPKDSKQPA